MQQISVKIFRISLAAGFIAVQDDLRRTEAGSKTGVALAGSHLGPFDGGERHSQQGGVGSLADDLVGAVQSVIQARHWGSRGLTSALLLEEKAGHYSTYNSS